MAKEKQPTRKSKMTLTLRCWEPSEVNLMNNLLKQTGKKQFTDALMEAAQRYEQFKNQIRALEKIIEKLQDQRKQSDEVLAFLNSSQRMLSAYGKKYLGKYPEPELF